MPRTIFDKKPRALGLGALISGYARMQGRSTEDLANMIDRSPNTVLSRLKHPGDITVDELLAWSSGIPIPLDELRAAIRR